MWNGSGLTEEFRGQKSKPALVVEVYREGGACDPLPGALYRASL